MHSPVCSREHCAHRARARDGKALTRGPGPAEVKFVVRAHTQYFDYRCAPERGERILITGPWCDWKVDFAYKMDFSRFRSTSYFDANIWTIDLSPSVLRRPGEPFEFHYKYVRADDCSDNTRARWEWGKDEVRVLNARYIPRDNVVDDGWFGYQSKSYRNVLAHPISPSGQPHDEIWFYEAHWRYYAFTNFYEGSPFDLEWFDFSTKKAGTGTGPQIRWKTVEHYYQAQKFRTRNVDVAERVCSAASPRAALNLAREAGTKELMRPDWDEYRKFVMYVAVFAKFYQNQRLRDMLLATGTKKLVERTANDRYWGDGGDGSGQNQLGEILMEVRRMLRRS